MKKFNVWKPEKSELQRFEDDRGIIADIFYKESINHVAILSSKKNSVRGNHYHKATTQHTMIIRGVMQYWYKSLEQDAKVSSITLFEGDIISSPPNQVHALLALEDYECLVFTEGVRGGEDYEKDTFRVLESIIPE